MPRPVVSVTSTPALKAVDPTTTFLSGAKTRTCGVGLPTTSTPVNGTVSVSADPPKKAAALNVTASIKPDSPRLRARKPRETATLLRNVLPKLLRTPEIFSNRVINTPELFEFGIQNVISSLPRSLLRSDIFTPTVNLPH